MVRGPPLDGRRVVHGLAGVGGHLQELLGVGSERAPGRGQRQPRLGALEQRDPQRAFQGLDARADGGLADPQRIGGPAKSAKSSDSHEGLELGNLHLIRLPL